MSILKDRIRPLDPSSLQEFLEPDGGAEVENAGTPSHPHVQNAGTPSHPHVENAGTPSLREEDRRFPRKWHRTCRWAGPRSSSLPAGGTCAR